jgi:exosortase
MARLLSSVRGNEGLSGVKPDRRTIWFLLSSLVLFALQWETIRDLIAFARNDATNSSQVLVIPFISAALIFWDRQRIFARVRYSVLPAILVVGLGLALMAVGSYGSAPLSEGNRVALATASTLTIWVGLFIGFFGVDAFRAGLFPLAFLVFTIPVPDLCLTPLVAVLQRGSAEISHILLILSGTPVYREDFVFNMAGLSINIAPECSGIRSFLSMVILTVLAGHLLLQTTWRRIALVLVAIPIMIFKNALRIVTLTLLSIHVDPRIIESRLHREGGIPFFLLALLLTYPVLRLLMKTEKAETENAGK